MSNGRQPMSEYADDFLGDNERSRVLANLARQTPKDRAAQREETINKPSKCPSCGSTWFREETFNQYRAETYSSRAGGELEKDADDLVLCLTQPLGAAPPMAVFEQQGLSARTRIIERRLEAAGDRGAQLALAAGMSLGEGREIGDDRRTIDELGGDARGAFGVQHHHTS